MTVAKRNIYRHRDWREGPASEKQYDLLLELIGKEEADAMIIGGANAGMVSARIDLELAKKKVERAVKATSFVPPELGYYLDGDDVFVVVESRTGNRYAKKLVLPKNRGLGLRAKWLYAPGKVQELDASKVLTVAEAARLGHLHGYCMVCGRPLDDPKSVDLGIGPTCRRRLQARELLGA